MAHLSSVYLPDLEACLTGRELLLSWQEAFQALRHDVSRLDDGPRADDAPEWNKDLLSFFADHHVESLLSKTVNTFPPPSSDSRTSFETRTSAINLADPGSKGPYNVQTIKDDTLWLSKEVKVDETTALRVVLLASQTRAAQRLLNSENAHSHEVAQSALGSSFAQSLFSESVGAGALLSSPAVDSETIDSVDARKTRLREIFVQESLHVLRIKALLVQLFYRQLNYGYDVRAPASSTVIFKVAQSLVASICGSDLSEGQTDVILTNIIAAIQERVKILERGPAWTVDQDNQFELDILWAQGQVDELVALCKVFYIIATNAPIAKKTVTSFIELVAKHGLLDLQISHISILSLDTFKTLLACIIVGLLSPAVTLSISAGTSSNPLWTDHDSMNKINSAMLDLATRPGVLVSITIYSWAIYVQASKTLNRAQSPIDDPSTYDSPSNLQALANAAVNDMQLFDNITQLAGTLRDLLDHSFECLLDTRIRESLLRVLGYSISSGLVGYEAEVIGAVLSLMDAEHSSWSAKSRTLESLASDKIVTDYLAPLLELSRSRFPLESAPLLRLLKSALLSGDSATEAYKLFASIFNTTITGFTDQLNPDFSAYDEADVDPSKGYFVELQSALPIFISRIQATHAHNDSDDRALVLAAQSNWQPLAAMDAHIVGEVLGDQTRPLIVDWNYSYNPMDYILDWLASAAPGSQHVTFSSLATPTDEECTDIIGLCNSLLDTLRHSDQDLRVAAIVESLLDSSHRGFEEDVDLISVVFNIFEYQVQLQRQQTSQSESSALLTECVRFVHAVSYFRPARIWPLLARSQLLDLDTNDPALVAIVVSSELITGRYNFLQSCVELFERLVDLAFVHGSSRAIAKPASTALTRFAHEASVSRPQYVPAKAIRNIMLGYLQVMVSVAGNSQFWQFESRSQKAAINTSLFRAFNRILRVTYGYPQEQAGKKSDNVLVECADKIADLCLDSSSSDGLLESIMHIVQAPPSVGASESPITRDALRQERLSSLELCTSLLHVAVYTHRDSTLLEERLFKIAPMLAKLFASSVALQESIASLMNILLAGALRNSQQPPSLLGHMGADVAKGFISLLTRLNAPCMESKQKITTWTLLSTVVSSQQQWFALYLLTGKTPKTSSTADTGSSGQAILQYALDQLSSAFAAKPSTEEQGLEIALAMLKFLTQSCNHWPTAVEAMRQHPKFIASAADYFSNLGRFDATVGSMTWHTAIGAALAEILTIYLHTARQAGDVRPALSLVNKLGYIKNFAFKPPQYNPVVQSLLKRNVASLFGDLDITRLQHSLAFPVEHGRNFFYDVPAAMAMISAARQASGRASNSHSFLKDFEHANLDLSKVDCQIELHDKAKVLAIELSNALVKDSKLQLVEPLIDILEDVLKNMNTVTTLPLVVADKLSESQVGLALTLLQKLVAIKDASKVVDLINLFPLIWSSVSEMLRDIDSEPSNDKLDMRRRLLQILYLGIQPLTQWKGKEPDLKASATATVVNRHASTTYVQLLEITAEIIAKGFKRQASAIHEDQSACAPSDFALLTAMLQTILMVPGVETIHSAMVLQLQNAEVSRYATSLFTWSDQLLVDGDPIYGEHSMLFLLELSTIPAMAEIMAVEGVLAQLSAANLMTLFSRARGTGPLDTPPGAHAIWARGILPLCLNLLSAIGAPIAAEVVAFLLQCAPQLARAARELATTNAPVGTRAGDTHLTLATAAELRALALLLAAVDALRAAGAAGAVALVPVVPREVWDGRAVAEDVDEWLGARTVRRDWIVPASEREVALLRMRPVEAGSRCESRLEERVWAELQGARDCLGV